MPSDSNFAIAMKSQKEAERAEQQRIKNLVLNYDLQDSSTDQTGTDNDLYFDYFSHSNPNLSKGSPGFPLLTPMEVNTLAYNDSPKGPGGEKHVASHHQHNASLHQPSNHANPRPADKSGANRGAHRARKLQLNDLDWYDQNQKPEQRPDSSRSRGRGRGSPYRRSHTFQRGRSHGVRISD